MPVAVTFSAMRLKDTDQDEVWFSDITGFNVRRETIPVIIAILILIFLTLFFVLAYLLWRCCMSSKPVEKKEALSISTIENNVSQNSNYSTFQRHLNRSSVSNKAGVVALIPEFENSMHWSHTNSDSRDGRILHHSRSVIYARRVSEDSTDTRNFFHRAPRPYSCAVVMSPVLNLDDYSLPQISEFSTQPCSQICNSSYDDYYLPTNSFNNFRTRSLPSCVRFKRHSAIIPGDSVADLYDKVNFSKKRKNRMRNNEAAIIALSKSRSQIFNKDTDSLVDNEAVIVYDERTAL